MFKWTFSGVLLKTPENKRDRMTVRIYADKDTPDQLLQALVAELEVYQFAAIYQVYKPKVQHYDYFHTFDRLLQ